MRRPSSGGDPQIQTRIQETHALLARLEKEEIDIAECHEWLVKIETTFQRRVVGFLPYSAYDVIWQAFNRIRHIFCRIVPVPDLLSVALHIWGSLSYIAKEEARKEHKADLQKIEEALRLYTAGHEPGRPHPSLSLKEIRFELERLSRLTADARDAHWRKVNLLRTRLLVTACILGALLLAGLWLVPAFTPAPDITWTHILAVIGFGALGGLVSALRTMESLEVSASAYYIQRTLLGLRPVIGASAGLILYLIQVSGILSIVPAGVNPQAAYLVLAFTAGFSERFFVAQVERVADLGKKEKKKPETRRKGEQTEEAS